MVWIQKQGYKRAQLYGEYHISCEAQVMATLLINNAPVVFKVSRKRTTPTATEIPSSVHVVIVKRRNKQMIETLRSSGWHIVDISTSAQDPVWQRFAPNFPHGNIPVPGMTNMTSMTVCVC